MKKWEELLTRNSKYLEMRIPTPTAPPNEEEDCDEVDEKSIPENHEDLDDLDKTETEVMLRKSPEKIHINFENRQTDPFEPLWTPPLYDSPEIKGIDNRKYFCDTQTIKSLQMGYDFPKNITPDIPSQQQRYENEPDRRESWLRNNAFQRKSNPDLISEMERSSSYDIPVSNKRVQSYLEMDKIDQHVQNNLNNEMKADKLSKELDDISFKFVSSKIDV